MFKGQHDHEQYHGPYGEDKPKCKLTGTDGNIFALTGKARKALKKANMKDKAEEMTNKINNCNNYNEALQLICEYVDAY